MTLQLGLGDLVPFHRGLMGHPQREAPYTRPEHFRMATEDLGTVLAKLGQVLSTRPDPMPPEYVVEFARLQDAAPPVAYEEVAAVVEAELGAAPEALYSGFDPVPRAAASIGQVHAARMPNGTQVVVKVQRPSVEKVVERDLAVLADLAHLAATRTALGNYYKVECVARGEEGTGRAGAPILWGGKCARTDAPFGAPAGTGKGVSWCRNSGCVG